MSLTILNAGQNYHIRGGSDRYQFDLASLLESRGHKVIPFAARQAQNRPTPWIEYFPEAVNFERPKSVDLFRFVYSRSAAKAIAKLLQASKPDVAHLHIYYGQLTSSILRPLRAQGIPIVQTLHEYKLVCPVYTLHSSGRTCEACGGHAFWHAVAQRCNRGSITRSLLSATESYVARFLGAVRHIDHFITVSDFQRNKVTELGVPAEKVTTVHNFIPATVRPPNDRPGNYLLYFGRLERIKGLFTLLEAAAALPEVPLLIVGSGSARNEAEAYVQRHGLSHVRFLGFQSGEKLQELIRNSLCSVLPSHWYETFGLAILESFTHGRTVVASRIGGMTEVISNGVDGFLVPPADVAALKERLGWLADNREAAVEMGLRGRLKTETQFGEHEHYRKLTDVYRKVLAPA